MNQQQRDIEVQEKKLSAIYPGLIKNRTITSIDNSGIILENASDTQLTKLFFKRRDQDKQLKQVIQFNNEVAALRLFHENSIDNIETPIILKEPQWLLSDDFFAMYTTTKIKGIAADWKTMSLSNGGERESMLQHFVSAGKILAKFHRVDIEGKKYGINAAQSPLYSIGTEIESIGKLRDSELNVRLALADEYFQANKVGGLVHGNFLDDVMMINDKGDITGIIDFNMTHYDYNIMIDFLYIPEVGIDHFIQGYEKESGMKIDPLMLPLTKISCLVASINKYWENKSVRDNKLYLLKGYLKQLGDEFSLNMGGKLRSYLANC